jgi:hypothetical protein
MGEFGTTVSALRISTDAMAAPSDRRVVRRGDHLARANGRRIDAWIQLRKSDDSCHEYHLLTPWLLISSAKDVRREVLFPT